MTVDELLARESIRQTLASYNANGDRVKVDAYVANFTEDALFEYTDADPAKTFRCEGREAIRNWFTGFGASRSVDPNLEAPKFVRHHLSTCDIQMTGPETANARTYFHVYTQIGPDHAGYYVDKFRKDGDRWLICERRIRTDWYAPGSLFVPARQAQATA